MYNGLAYITHFYDVILLLEKNPHIYNIACLYVMASFIINEHNIKLCKYAIKFM